MAITESVLYISVSDVDPTQKDTYPDVVELTQSFLKDKPLSKEALQRTLQAYVLAGSKLDCIKFLIDHGADVNYSYAGGDKLLRMAHQNGNSAVINLLLKNSAALTNPEQKFFRDIDPDFARSNAFVLASAAQHSKIPSNSKPGAKKV